ncbi:MAG TPA: MFS transporter, partial [Gammaproteobacteria bacterium]|nr:MFS transporter [Gammaproteobacteria bacterium]
MTNRIAAGASAERIAPGTIMALVAMALAVFVLANDFTAMSVALTQIEHDFNSDVATVQWVINAYALVFGVLIVTGGKLADMFGRRRIFFIGTAIFALFSFLGGIA